MEITEMAGAAEADTRSIYAWVRSTMTTPLIYRHSD